MYSQCPECQTRFRVTAEALRIARGTVRCGRCGSAFNALTRLSDSPTGTSAGTTDTSADDAAGAASSLRDGDHTASDQAQPGEFHFTAEDIERVFVDSRDWQRQFGTEPHGVAGFDAPASRAGAATDGDAERVDVDSTDEPRVEVDENEAFEDITLEGERVVIEGLPDFLLDSSAHELADAELLEAQADARARLLPDLGTMPQPSVAAADQGNAASAAADESILVDAARAESLAESATPQLDLDATDRFEVLAHVPDSAYPEIESDDAYVSPAARAAPKVADAGDALLPIEAGPRPRTARKGDEMPRVVATAAAGNPPAPGATPGSKAAIMPSVVATAAAMSASAAATPAPGDLRPTSSRSLTQTATAAGRAGADSPGVFESEELDDESSTSRRGSWAWGIGALLLAIALMAQLVHQYRHELVRDPNVGPALRSLYEQLGLPLSPNWDLAAYELRQWGPTETQPTSGHMTLRASIKNRAAFAQPLPLLRLELEDRFGGVVGRRDFEPKEYLRDPAQASRMLAAGVATEAELELADTTQEAVGYRLDICIRDAGAGIRCAQGKTR